MERWDGYQLGPMSEFERVVFRPVPDRQTQMAEMMAGNLDVIVASSPDRIAAMTAMPGFAATVIPDMMIQYMYLDAAGARGSTCSPMRACVGRCFTPSTARCAPPCSATCSIWSRTKPKSCRSPAIRR